MGVWESLKREKEREYDVISKNKSHKYKAGALLYF